MRPLQVWSENLTVIVWKLRTVTSYMTDTCFVCLDPADREHPFTEPLCKCKGSLHLHTHCYIRLRELHAQCPICKTPYPMVDLEYENGLPVKVFTASDGLIHRYTYVDDATPHGIYYTYYPCGALGSLGVYKYGEPYKVTRKWSRNGALRERYSYLDGKLNSYYYKWDESGKQTSVVSYYRGELSGRVYTFIDDETVKITAHVRGRIADYLEYVHPSTLPDHIRVSAQVAGSVDGI